MSNVKLNGIGNLTHVTYYLDTTTTTQLGDDIEAVLNKFVTVTGSKEVGYGSSGDAIEGLVTKVEEEYNGSDKLVVTVYTDGFFVDVEATGLSVKDYVTVDGSGGLTKAGSGTTNAQVVEADTDKNLYSIHVR